MAAAPDLADFLTPEQREDADRIALPVVRVAGPVKISGLLENANAFAALVIDGMLLSQLRIGEQPTLRIFGPGELVASGAAPPSTLLIESDCRAVDPTHLAIIGIEFLAGAHRWPRLIAGLQARVADGQERLATQLAICQLPRVQDRLLAMLWLLAESWGRVTSAGTTLSLSLTHEALGALVGARRPTVTLALRELTERGALVHQDRSWLLLEPPPAPTGGRAQIDEPEILSESGSPWTASEAPATTADTETHDMLRETLLQLREDHRRNAEQHKTILRELSLAQEHNADIRRRIREQVVRHPSRLPPENSVS
ncbi:MAG: helix-turn-helix domain-containing protein [Solirubrobacteraceae bacterium]